MDRVRRILIVDDGKDLITVLAIGLKQIDPSITIRTAFSGASCLEAAVSFQPHGILLDCHLPDMAGYEVCRLIKNNSKTRETAVLLMTGEDISRNSYKAADSGADGIIDKPFDCKEILDSLTTLMKEKEAKLNEPMR